MALPQLLELPHPFQPERDTPQLNEILRTHNDTLNGGVGAENQQGGTQSQTPAGTPGGGQSSQGQQPAKPTSVSCTAGTNNVTNIPYIDVTWVQPAGVTAAYWEVRWRREGATGVDAVYRYRDAGKQEYRIENVRPTPDGGPNMNYEVGVQAISANGVQSGYPSSDTVVTTPSGAEPPPENGLKVDKLLTGTMVAQVLLSGNIRTSDTGRRVALDPDGLVLYDNQDAAVVFMRTSSGEAEFGSILTAPWTAHSGTWGIQSNEGYLVAGTDSSVVTLTPPAVQSYITLKLRLGGAGGLVFRFSGTNDFVLLQLTTTSLTLWKNVAGVFTALGVHTTSTTAGTIRTLAVHDANNQMKCYLDSTLVLNVTDSFNSTQARCGLRSGEGPSSTRYLTLTAGEVSDNFDRANSTTTLGSNTSAAKVLVDGRGVKTFDAEGVLQSQLYSGSGVAKIKGLLDSGIVIGSDIFGGGLTAATFKSAVQGARIEINPSDPNTILLHPNDTATDAAFLDVAITSGKVQLQGRTATKGTPDSDTPRWFLNSRSSGVATDRNGEFRLAVDGPALFLSEGSTVAIRRSANGQRCALFSGGSVELSQGLNAARLSIESDGWGAIFGPDNTAKIEYDPVTPVARLGVSGTGTRVNVLTGDIRLIDSANIIKFKVTDSAIDAYQSLGMNDHALSLRTPAGTNRLIYNSSFDGPELIGATRPSMVANDVREWVTGDTNQGATINAGNTAYREHLANPHTNTSDPSTKVLRRVETKGALARLRAVPVWRYKSDIEVHDKGLDKAPERIGLMATDVPEEIQADMVLEGHTDNPRYLKGIRTDVMDAFLWKAVQELADRVDVVDALVRRIPA